MNRLYKNIINILVIVPFPNALVDLSSNVFVLAHLSFVITLMLVLLGGYFATTKIKTGLLLIYVVVWSILLLNMTNLFAFTFTLRVLFAITAGWFLYRWNFSTSEAEFVTLLKRISYILGVVSFLMYLIDPPLDGRLISLFDVHTSKYLFFAFTVIFSHQVLKYNRTSDYVALCFSFLLLSLSLQRGILITTIIFLVLIFRDSVFRKLAWMGLVAVVAYQVGFFDPLIKRLFYHTPTSANVQDLLANVNSSGRFAFWSYLWTNEKVSFFGNGLGHSIEIGKTYFPGLGLVHNDFLWLLMDIGIFGLIVLMLIVLYVNKRISRQEDRMLRRVYGSLLLSIPFVMFVDNFIFHIYLYFPLLFAYFTLYSKRFKHEFTQSVSDVQLG